MPKKALYDKDTIICSALDIVKKSGMGALSARSLARRLGCSVAPIFGLFADMEDVRAAAVDRMKSIYSSFVREGLKTPVPFKGVGTAYIRFAMEEPNFFRVLFMSDNADFTISNILEGVDDNYAAIFDSVVKSYSLSYKDSQRLYLHMWIYTHGIAVLCVTGTCSFTPDEIESMISEACQSIIKNMRERA